MTRHLPGFVASIAAGTVLVLSPDLTLAQTQQPEFPTARIAFFNAERVTSESAIGKAGLARLESYRATTNREIQERNQTLQDERDRLERSATVLNQDARRERERLIQNFEVDLQRFIEDAQAEFLGIQQVIEREFLITLQPVIEGVAEQKDVHFLFTYPAPGFVWADPRFDITDDLIEQLDATADD